MKKKEYLVNGPIKSDFIVNSIAKHQSMTNIGAHAIFLGQVRADVIDDKNVEGIEYSAYNEMAEKEFHKINETAFAKYPDMNCMHIKHSLGMVKSGEMSLFVFVSCGHRKQAFKALEEVVNEIKAKVPIWKKELLEGGDHAWTENT